VARRAFHDTRPRVSQGDVTDRAAAETTIEAAMR